MAQAAGQVNVVLKLNKAAYQTTGARVIGDGSTANDVGPKEAANLALNGSLQAGSDVLIDESDFTVFVKSLENLDRS